MKHIIIVLLLGVHTWAVEPARAPEGAERAVVAAVIIAESGGDNTYCDVWKLPVKGMAAVYEVVFERASRRRTSCYAEVIRRKQFSCLNKVTPAELVQRMSKHPEYKWVHDELLGGAIDPETEKPGKMVPLTSHTGLRPGARCTHYHTTKVSPYWAKNKKPAFTFGGHHWYNNIR